MAGYKEIKGFQVQTRSEDPLPYAQALENNPYAELRYSGTFNSYGVTCTKVDYEICGDYLIRTDD